MNWANIAERALWTFVQSAVSAFIAIEITLDLESVQSALVAAGIAGGSAVLSLLKTVAQERLSQLG